MIKNFDEFISYQETIEEGKVKNIAIAASIAMNLIFGAKYLKNHQLERYSIEHNQEARESVDNAGTIKFEEANCPGESYYPSDEILSFIKKSEGWHKGWRSDGKGIQTTGWGFRYTDELKEKYPNGMTREQANKYFDEVAIPDRVKLFKKSVPNLEKYTQNQLDALFDLFYNIGGNKFRNKSPKLQDALKEMNYEEVAKNIDHDYNNKKLPGIKIRRDFERDLFMQDVKSDES